MLAYSFSVNFHTLHSFKLSGKFLCHTKLLASMMHISSSVEY